MPSKEKIDAFLKEYKELVEKHRVDIMSYPVYVPVDEHGGFKLVIQSTPISTEAEGVKSPFVMKE